MKKEQIKGSLSLFLAAIIWGAAFVAQSVGMDYVGPFTFNCVRTLIGGIVLIPCIAFLNRGKVRKKTYFTEKKRLLLGGICCGVALATGSTLQQFGIMYTTVGKAGFITAFYIIIVPILGLFLGKKCGLSVWISVVIALAGLYFLCITDGFSIGKGDIYVFRTASSSWPEQICSCTVKGRYPGLLLRRSKISLPGLPVACRIQSSQNTVTSSYRIHTCFPFHQPDK